MNICIITSSFPSHPDDIVQVPFLVDFIKGLKKRGHQIFVFTQDRKGEKKEFLKGVKVKWFPWMKSKKPLVQLNPFNPLDFFRIVSLFYNGKKELLPFVKENKIEACLALWVLPSGYFANHAYRQARIPYSIWSLGSDIYRYGRNPFPLSNDEENYSGSQRCFCRWIRSFEKSRRTVRKEMFFFSHHTNNPPPPPFAASPEGLQGRRGVKDGLGGSDRPYRFLFVGRIEKVKGIDLLLQSMALLIRRRIECSSHHCGKGKMEEWVKNFIHKKDSGNMDSVDGKCE